MAGMWTVTVATLSSSMFIPFIARYKSPPERFRPSTNLTNIQLWLDTGSHNVIMKISTMLKKISTKHSCYDWWMVTRDCATYIQRSGISVCMIRHCVWFTLAESFSFSVCVRFIRACIISCLTSVGACVVSFSGCSTWMNTFSTMYKYTKGASAS